MHSASDIESSSSPDVALPGGGTPAAPGRPCPLASQTPCSFSSARPSDAHSRASRGLMAADTPVDPLPPRPHGAAQPPNAAADAGHVPRLDLGSVRSQAAPSGALATARASGRSAALRRLLRRHVVLNAHANRQGGRTRSRSSTPPFLLSPASASPPPKRPSAPGQCPCAKGSHRLT